MQERFYLDETVRLLRQLPGVAVAAESEGTVTAVPQAEASTVEVRFRTAGGAVQAVVPCDAIEPVISQAGLDRTAVFWGLEMEPEQLMEAALHSVLDSGLTLRAGLNVARLHYDPRERWWKWGERMTDASGARVAAAGHTWDGSIVALSGPERFHLEFRPHGPGQSAVLLHEQDAAYTEQARKTEASMGLARVLTSLYSDIAAEFCAFPVADPWLMDEDWRSLLLPPYYPDFFLLPETTCPAEVPGSFHAARLTHDRIMLTALPILFDPAAPPVEREARDLQLDRLRKCNALGEKYYSQLYETRVSPAGLYSSAKDAFLDAISTARELGLSSEEQALEKRLENIKGVFRSQFS